MARYALVVGIEKYKDRHLNDLTKAVADATEVAEILKNFGEYRTTLLRGEVSVQTFADEIKKLLKQGTNQEVVIYFSGHGLLKEEPDPLKKSSPEGFLAASNSTITKKNGQCISIKNGLKIESIVELIQETQLSNLVFILDACHSGSLIKEVGKQFEIFGNNTDYAILAGCQDYEVAWAKIKDKYSLFTGALLNALKKDYIDDNREIQLGGVADRVYAKLKTSRQEPICLVKGRSFPFLTYPVTCLMNDSVQKKKLV